MSEDTEQSGNPGIKAGLELLRQLEEAGTPYPESPAKIVARLSRYANIYPMRNLAVEVCDQSFESTAQQAVKEGNSYETAKELGRVAYCASLPKLAGASNIRDFIACITHAMAMGYMPSIEGTRLLYAAQVAQTARTKRPKKRNKSSLTNTPVTPATTKESTP
jgi:hypothetical protein